MKVKRAIILSPAKIRILIKDDETFALVPGCGWTDNYRRRFGRLVELPGTFEYTPGVRSQIVDDWYYFNQ